MTGFCKEVIPPPPTNYFNDYVGVVSPATAKQLNLRLAQFERDTSDQVVVTIFPTMQSDAPINEYAMRVMWAWEIGQNGKNNGAGLFLFTRDHEIYLKVGYGLEKALPNELCKSVIDDKIVPHLKTGDFDGGMTAGVDAILDAAKSEFRSTTALEKKTAAMVVPQPTNGSNNTVAAPPAQ